MRDADGRIMGLAKRLPINSRSLSSEVRENEVEVKGYAYAGGGDGVDQVEYTLDRGKTWNKTEISYQADQKPGEQYATTFWRTVIGFDSAAVYAHDFEACFRATSTAGEKQPWKHPTNQRGLHTHHIQCHRPFRLEGRQ